MGRKRRRNLPQQKLPQKVPETPVQSGRGDVLLAAILKRLERLSNRIEKLKPESLGLRWVSALLPSLVAVGTVWLTSVLTLDRAAHTKASEVYAEHTFLAVAKVRAAAYRSFNSLDEYYMTSKLDPKIRSDDSNNKALKAADDLRDAIESHPFRLIVQDKLRAIHAAVAGYYSRLNATKDDDKRQELATQIHMDLTKQRKDLEQILEGTLPK